MQNGRALPKTLAERGDSRYAGPLWESNNKNPLPRSFDPADARRIPRVITNPIYVDVDGDGQWPAPGGKTCSYSVGP